LVFSPTSSRRRSIPDEVHVAQSLRRFPPQHLLDGFDQIVQQPVGQLAGLDLGPNLRGLRCLG
jgi:hypothetical protein